MAKILLLCMDKVGQAMAGPAIRYWEMANILSKSHDVTLVTPNKPDINTDRFKLYYLNEISLSTIIYESDILIAQSFSPVITWHAKRKGTQLILDAYDPMPLENLEIFRHESPRLRKEKHQKICKQFSFDFKMADGVICANQRQKDLWMGLLLNLGKITPELYDSMPSLDKFLNIVPFGLSSTPPSKNGTGLREKFSIPANAKVLLWGGGIWNWFDPLTLLHAMDQIKKVRNDIHLVFMGIKHPNEHIPEMKMCKETIELAEKLNLLGKNVHINYGWIPYEERVNYLLEADIGVSTHFDHLETQYSFRTRMLDYLWAGLPIIATEGDCFADLISSRGLGWVVPFMDSARLASAITTLCDQPVLLQDMRRNISALRPEFEWQHVLKPLEFMIERLMSQKISASWMYAGKLFSETWKTHGTQYLLKYCFSKFKRLVAKPFKYVG